MNIEENNIQKVENEVSKLNLNETKSRDISEKVRNTLVISIGILLLSATTIRTTIANVLNDEKNTDSKDKSTLVENSDDTKFIDDISFEETDASPIDENPNFINTTDVEQYKIEGNNYYNVVIDGPNKAVVVDVKNEIINKSENLEVWINSLDTDFFKSAELGGNFTKLGTRLDKALIDGNGTVIVMIKAFPSDSNAQDLGRMALRFTNHHGNTSVEKINIDDISTEMIGGRINMPNMITGLSEED